MDTSLILILKNMGIYDLRNFARSVGVAKPTTLKRQELISAILDIKTGNQEPLTGLNRGRKPKNKESAYDLLNRYSNDYIDYEKTTQKINSDIETNSPQKKYISKELKTNETTYIYFGEIVIEDEDQEGWFLYNSNKIIVPNYYIKKYNLKNNDYITVTCIQKNDVFVTIDVKDKESVLSVPFSDLKVLNKTSKMQLSNSIFDGFNSKYTLYNGQCVQLSYSFKIAPEKILLSLVNSINKKKYEVFALLTDEFNMPDIRENIERLEILAITEDINQKVEKIDAEIEEIKQFVSSAQKVVLIIGNLSLILSIYKSFFIQKGNSEAVSNMMAVQKVMEILNISRQTESGSITTFVACAETNIEELKSLFNAKLEFEFNNELKLTENSYSIY